MMWGILAYSFINILVGTFFVKKSVGVTLWDQVKSGLPLSVLAAAAVIAGYFAASPIDNIYARVSVSGILSAGLYIGVCCLVRDQSVKFFLNYFRRN